MILFVVGVVMFGAITYLPTFLQIANGASASNSGLLLVPLIFGIFGSSIVAGQIISRTGRYRIFPIVGIGDRDARHVPPLDARHPQHALRVGRSTWRSSGSASAW